ncbi:NAD(P)-dependent dehydrogenase (short-subunit alcohol dehydrogenase family) [Antricoccus suffuscus]|uniref:NAD(P)-dependent dehydrogenase (Short-subunit alcohol dehydrogenase family) n=1 Tax=Antricoccus suffuscus TaxID=1629062 RepID=A0A2T1A1H2_9ACTN|nr:SDR family oxidoreductase [Antricoccus suffuscus]PRZ42460.1 NAD(P)-dependent dehydrogenase (short-subunit alcohol dehydrogenase family) [Antricoccus suffuscus]
MSGLLENKSVLVTGAGSGIGRASAQAVAREGGAVTVADIKLAGAQETVDMITQAGGRAVAVEVDVTDEVQVDAMVTAAEDAFGPLDCAFNNAGIARGRDHVPGTLTAQTSFQAWQDVLGVNLNGVFLCLRRELQSMEKRGAGAILNTASVAGLIGLAGASPYTASKHAVVGLTKASALEYAKTGIRVNALCPGYVTTPMTNGTKQGDDKRMERVPMGRYGTVDEVAELVVWLLSDRASFCTGSSFTVGGGIEAG